MENCSAPCNCSFLQKTDIYVIIAFFLFGGIQMTFDPQDLQATLCSTVCLSVIVSVMFAILSPLSTGKRFLKALVLTALTILGAVLGGSLCLCSLPLTLALITWNLYRENPDADTRSVQEHEQNIKSLNIAYLIVAVLCLIVFAGVQMFKEMDWGNGLDLIAAYVWKEIYGGTFDNDTESQIRFCKDLIVILPILALIVTPLLSFQLPNRKKSYIYIFSLAPSYLIAYIAWSMTKEKDSHVMFMDLFALGSHFYFILSHVAALIAIARDREVKLLQLQEGNLTSTKSESALSKAILNKVFKNGDCGITGFILVIAPYLVTTILCCLGILDIQPSSSLIMAFGVLSELLTIFGLFCCVICVRKKERHRKFALAGIIIVAIPVLISVMLLTIGLYIMPALKV
jgi:hypothetical protein